MNLAERLKIARESIGKSQKEMAESLGTSFRAWQDYEAGKNVPGGKVFESLVRLGFNGTWLLTGSGVMRGEVLASPVVRLEESVAHDALRNRLKFKNERCQHLNIESYGVTWDIFMAYVDGSYMPTETEIRALCAIAEWDFEAGRILTTGNVKTEGLNREIKAATTKNIEPLPLDEDLLKNILAAIEIVADDLGREENILSASDRIMITIKLYNIFSKEAARPYVTLDRMIEQVMNTYFLRISSDKIENLRNKIKQDPSNPVLDIIDTFIDLRKDIDEMSRNVELSGKDGEEKGLRGEDYIT